MVLVSDMFVEEAAWIGNALRHVDSKRFPCVANIGSSTASFRRYVQPHIEAMIFAPLGERGFRALHIDIKHDDGIDVVADITRAEFGHEYADRFDIVLCTNLLEHVDDPIAVAKNLWCCCAPESYLLLTVPYRYREHRDPIDNMFRPTPAEIHALFPREATREITSAIIEIRDRQYYKFRKSRFPLWGYREIAGYHLGLRHKVSGLLLKVSKSR